MAYAKGKYAYGICDISGFRYKLKDMKKTWNVLLVGPDMYEPKHPQLEPRPPVIDPEALQDPRVTEPEPTAGNGVVRTENTVANGISSPSTFVSHNDVIGSSFRSNQITSELGSVTVNIGS